MNTVSKKRIVVLGAGFGGVYTVKHLHRLLKRRRDIEIVLVNNTNYFLFTPLLHEVATGSIAPANIVEPIRKALGTAVSEFYLDEVKKVSLTKKQVRLKNKTLSYDYLVAALGAHTNFFGTPGAEKHAFTLKTLDDAILLKNHMITAFEQASTEADKKKRLELLSFVVVGGGPTGVELASEMAELFFKTFAKEYPKKIIEEVTVTLIQRSEELIPQYGAELRTIAQDSLTKLGVTVRCNSSVTDVSAHSVTLGDNTVIPAHTVVWCAGIDPCGINCTEPIGKEKNGKIIVNEFLQVPNYPEVFVLGDSASSRSSDTGELVPALAQVATKQGEFAAHTISHIITKKPLKSFTYRHSGSLVSFGQWNAGADLGGIILNGKLAWWFWRTIYVSKLISFTKKVQVIVDWTLNLFSPRDIARLYTNCKHKDKR